MDTLRLKRRQPVQDEVEIWDDDDFVIESDGLAFQGQLASANATAHRRDSHSSLRSELESIHGEEEKQVLLPGDDERSTLDAIAAAAKAGIPIPANVPPSALTGGTIKRLGGRKIKRIIQEDWSDDLELPDSAHSLAIKPQDGSKFPDSLRQVSSSTQASPTKPPREPFATIEGGMPGRPSRPLRAINLDRFRDTDDDDDFFGDGAATIRVAKSRQGSRPISLVTPPTPRKDTVADDDFERDLELPSDGKLKLSTRRDIPRTPALSSLDDFDWGEGSLGTRFGGTRRDGRSNRSSSLSGFSPSIASSFTVESEDETFDGLVLPSGPVDFEERLSKQRRSRSPERPVREFSRQVKPSLPPAAADKDDFLAGLDLGDGDVFDSRKLTLHQNIRIKQARPASLHKPKTSVALKFTNKPAAVSRLPRPLGPGTSHERSHTQPSLEPVSESGGPIPQSRRSLSRLGHSSQASISSIPTPTTPMPGQTFLPPTPRRGEVAQRSSTASLRDGSATSNAQLLRLKRSLPAMKNPQPPSRPPVATRASLERPSSRTDVGISARPQSSLRSKTPVDRSKTVESAAALARKSYVPFLPAGASASQSHNINARSSRNFRRHDSETAIDFRPHSRAVSRSAVRSPSPRKHHSLDKISYDGAWQQLSKPRRVRNFGDGHELDVFDDLPTSSQAEAKFIRQPATAGPRAQLRNKGCQSILPDRTGTPSPFGPPAFAKTDKVPSFARDTAASRIARETSLAQRTPSGGGPFTPVAPLTAQRVAQLSSRHMPSPHLPQSVVRSRKLRRTPQSKPHLISNLNPPKDKKMVNGMFYNPETFRWEGNDNVLIAFDAPASTPSAASIPPSLVREKEKENATPRPALITKFGTSKARQVVGGMQFDPENMCWVKVAPPRGRSGRNELPGGLPGGFDVDNDDEDVFKGIPDLEDHTMDSNDGGQGRASDTKDDWLVGEEFDVGPEFVRRQREEEERWKRKCEKWVHGTGSRDRDAWRWAIRDIVNASLRD